MTTWQAFLLGLMVAYTPSLIFLAFICHDKGLVLNTDFDIERT
jgi:hypothetical protein